MKIKSFYYLGTGAGLPSLLRNVSSMAVDMENEWFLFDCGEGTQQRIMKSYLKMSRLTHIFISHFHGDHLYGLPGLLSTMQLQGLYQDITLIGPKGLRKYLEFVFQISESRIKRELHFIEIENVDKPALIYTQKDFEVWASKMNHKVTCYAYRLKMNELPGKFDVEMANKLGVPQDERRRKLIQGEAISLDNGSIIYPHEIVSEKQKNPDFTYVTDTSFTENIIRLAENSDYLHHECTFADDERELADKSFHCTINDVLSIADKANIKQLHLAHFSSRYDSGDFKKLIKNHPYKVIMTKDKMQIPAEL